MYIQWEICCYVVYVLSFPSSSTGAISSIQWDQVYIPKVFDYDTLPSILIQNLKMVTLAAMLFKPIHFVDFYTYSNRVIPFQCNLKRHPFRRQ